MPFRMGGIWRLLTPAIWDFSQGITVCSHDLRGGGRSCPPDTCRLQADFVVACRPVTAALRGVAEERPEKPKVGVPSSLSNRFDLRRK
jgi:hypothetical protein